MALTPVEEAQTRQLIAQEAPLLSLASNEPTITSKLGATKVNLSQLPAATVPADADIYLVRQGTTDKSVAGSVLKTYFATAAPPAASETVAGIVRLATLAETQAGTSQLLAVDPANLAVSYPGIQGAFKNLAISTTGTSAPITVTADELVVENTSNAYRTLRAVSVTPSLANANGANGLDTGTSAISTWYAVWVIWNGTTTAGLLSLSATTPTMPSGYTHKARVGWIRTDATANKYPLSFFQIGKKARYKPTAGSNVTGFPIMSSGGVGTAASPTAVSVNNFIPSTSNIFNGAAGNPTVVSVFSVAPSLAFGTYTSTSNPPPIWQATGSDTYAHENFEMILESRSLYYYANGGGAYLICTGWEDTI